jgi:hypothetical protein
MRVAWMCSSGVSAPGPVFLSRYCQDSGTTSSTITSSLSSVGLIASE